MTFKDLPNEVIKLLDRDVILPQTYENAKLALSQCNNIDECKDWKDKAAALASYAKQASDDTLHKYAMRITNRATRRCGELLKQFDARGGDHGNQFIGGKTVVDHSFAISQNEVAKNAGLSQYQQAIAIRIANIPEDKFNELVESDNVPIMTKLADMGKKQIINKFKETPKLGFLDALYMSGAIEDLAKMMKEHDALYIIGGAEERHIKAIKENIKTIENWFDNFMINV